MIVISSIFKRTIKRKDGTTYEKWTGKATKNYVTKTFYGATKKEVEQKIKAYENDIEEYGCELDNIPITLADLVHKHLFTNVQSTVANSTFEKYYRFYNKHIKNTKIGDKKISDLKYSDIQLFFNDKVKKKEDENDDTKLVPRSLKTLKHIIQQSLDFAIKDNLLRINPCVDIKIPTSDIPKKEIEILTLQEQEKYISVLGSTKYKLLFLTALFTGMRLGELIALKWTNVDLKENTITVSESYKRTTVYKPDGTSERITDKKTPKTQNSNRLIPIPKQLSKLLKEHKLSSKSDYVFSCSSGRYVAANNIGRIQVTLCKKADIPYKNFHALRHTYATRLIENGTDIKTVSKLLGHTDIQTTLNIYVHSTDESKKSAVEILGNQFAHIIR